MKVAPAVPAELCRVCGKTLKPNAVFCTACGSAVSAAAPVAEKKTEAPAAVPTEKTKKKGKGLVILVCILLAAVLALGGIFSYLWASGAFESDGGSTPGVEEPKKPDEGTPVTPTPVPKVSTYTVSKEDLTWHEAQMKAQAQGGNLVCINDAQEFGKVCALADENELSVFWIGAYRTEEQYWSEVLWLDGKPIEYASWLKDEPTYISPDTGNAELYLMVFKVDDTWYYNDAENDVSQHYAGRMGYIAEIEE